jgi:hypothetical protein
MLPGNLSFMFHEPSEPVSKRKFFSVLPHKQAKRYMTSEDFGNISIDSNLFGRRA